MSVRDSVDDPGCAVDCHRTFQRNNVVFGLIADCLLLFAAKLWNYATLAPACMRDLNYSLTDGDQPGGPTSLAAFADSQ